MSLVATTESGVQVHRLHDVMTPESEGDSDVQFKLSDHPPEVSRVIPPPKSSQSPHTPMKTTNGCRPIWTYLHSTSPDLLAPGPYQAGGASTMEDSEDPNDHDSEDNDSDATAATVVDTQTDTPTDTPIARASYIVVTPRTPLQKRPPRNRFAVKRVLPTQLTETRIKVDELEVHPSKVSTQPQPSPQP